MNYREMKETGETGKRKSDVAIIVITSLIFAGLYIAFEQPIMEYGRNPGHALPWRFLPVAVIQYGMAGLGISIVLCKNKESLRQHGLVRKNLLWSVGGCLAVSVPTVLFLYFTGDIHGFLPFQGMFLTEDILHASFPFNIMGYLVVAVIWGFFEGLYYIVLSDKINALKAPRGVWNMGALVCAVFAVLIHGMIGISMEVLLEAAATFILMYGSLVIRDKTGNAWGNILIFFVVWNAL